MMRDEAETAEMSPDELAEAGRRLVGAGHGWLQRYADLLGINYDNLRKMIAGRRPVPPARAEAIRRMVESARGPQTVTVTLQPPPAALQAEQDRDGPCGEAMDSVLDEVARAAGMAGWHPAEFAAAVLTWVTHRVADGAGEDAARQALEDAAELLALRGRP